MKLKNLIQISIISLLSISFACAEAEHHYVIESCNVSIFEKRVDKFADIMKAATLEAKKTYFNMGCIENANGEKKLGVTCDHVKLVEAQKQFTEDYNETIDYIYSEYGSHGCSRTFIEETLQRKIASKK